MKNLLVLVLVACCSCSFSFDTWGQMLDEGTTVTTEIEQQGNVETVTETTVTIEHKTTGDVLDSDNGIVATSKDGNVNTDWGGAGSIYPHSACTDAASGFPATGTDGRTSGCGHARTNSLTTWRQYVDLNSFDINEGGEVNYEFLFAFPDSMYQNSGQTAYVQTKGYNDNVLQWETGLVTIDKTTFTQNPYNYNNNTNWVNIVTGSHDFANQLDKVYIEIGGYGEYYWDEFQYNVAYNHITTVVDTWMQVVQQQELENTITTLTPIYEEPVYEEEIVQDIPIEIEMPDVNVDVAVMDEPVFEDLGFEPDVPIVEMPEEIEVMAEVETVVAEIEQIDSISQPELTEPIVEIETPTEEPTANETQAEAPTEETTENEPVKEVVVEKSEPEPEPVEKKQEVAEEPQQEEGEKKEVVEEVKEEKQVAEEKQEEKKEVAQNDVKEKEPVQKNVKQEKQSKQEQKQAKAKEILNNLVDPYSSVAQMTTLALVNALGPNIKTYSAPVQTQPTWYESEEIYADAILQDPLGNYFGVRDSLTFNKMIDMQYE